MLPPPRKALGPSKPQAEERQRREIAGAGRPQATGVDVKEDCSPVQRIPSVGDRAQANRDETGVSRGDRSRDCKAAERLAVYGCFLAVWEAAEVTSEV